MKKDDILRAVGEIDDEYIAEAAPVRKKRGVGWYKFAALAACLAIVFSALGLYLFLPGDIFEPDVTKYKDSDYYQIITRLEPMYRSDSSSNFDYLFGVVTDGDDTSGGDAPTIEEAGGSEQYVEVTDNQVAGVIEGDLIKRSSTHIYYLHLDTLYVYSIEGEDSRLVGRYVLPKASDSKYTYENSYEMFLSDDANTVTLIAPYYTKGSEAATSVISINVSDPTKISERGRVTVCGGYISSRLTDGKLLLISSYRPLDPEYDKPETFVPKIDTGTGMKAITPDSIVYPDVLNTSTYTVVTSLDPSDLSLNGCKAFLSYSEEIYTSADAIYATRSYTDKHESGSIYTYTRKTDISKLSYGDETLEFKGTFTVDGYVKDQYSLDEHEGVLRVVTTTEKWGYGADIEETGTNASLYCIDAETFEPLAEVKNFAPWGETVRSVRFDGKNAYVCTSVQLSDPVFFFDLSDLENITFTDTGTIEGFSTSLVNFGDGYLVGIGVGDATSTLKIEVYAEDGDNVVSICSYEMKNTYCANDYKAYYIDRENRLIGLGVECYSGEKFKDNGGQGYILLSFDGYALHELLAVELGGNFNTQRGVYIEEYFYMLGGEDMIVRRLS